MPLTSEQRSLLTKNHGGPSSSRVKHGLEIFGDGDYPSAWSDFVGQGQAVEQLRAAVASATTRGKRLDHILLACGIPGVGKTTLAKLIAFHSNAGYVEVSGSLTYKDARKVLEPMADGDVLFWDEFHTAVAKSRTAADWMLPFLTDHVLLSATGSQEMPDVTVIGATTDVGKLPETIISRFMVKPLLDPYSWSEATQITRKLADRMSIPTHPGAPPLIAAAAANNPRRVREILTALRDSSGDLDRAFRWVGVTPDGLDRTAQEFMITLIGAPDYTASIQTIQSTLGEPGPLRYAEQTLLQRGYVAITGRGRTLTETGLARTVLLLQDGVAA